MPLPSAPGTPAPTLPGAMAGKPTTPGGSPVVAPGAGAGQMAVASMGVKKALEFLHKQLSSFPLDTKEFKAVSDAVKSLSKVFSSPNGGNGIPPKMGGMPGAGVAPGIGGATGAMANVQAPGQTGEFEPV